MHLHLQVISSLSVILMCIFLLTLYRIILPEWVDGTVSNTTILSVLVYEAIKTRKTVNHRTMLGKVDRQKDLIGFPCKPR